MTRNEAKEKLEKFITRQELDQIEIFNLWNKFNLIPDELFLDMDRPIYHFVNEYKVKKSVNHTAPKSKTYFLLNEPIANSTEKAIGIVTGSNNLHGSSYHEHIEWIPISQILKIEDKIFIPTWIIAKSDLWNIVDKNIKISQ